MFCPVGEGSVQLQGEVGQLQQAGDKLSPLVHVHELPEYEELAGPTEAGVGEEVVERIEVPAVELDVNRTRADYPNKVTQEEGEENSLGAFCLCRWLFDLFLLLEDGLVGDNVEDENEGVEKDNGQTGPEEEMHQDGMKRGDREKTAHNNHRQCHCQWGAPEGEL